MCDIHSPQFNDETAAREYLEKQRWPNGAACPHCGGFERIYPVKANEAKRVRDGLYHCNDCNGQFTVTVGTIFEGSKVPLHKWLMATYMMASSKKGVSSKQLERSLGVSYKTAWFMSHRIREAMKSNNTDAFGSGGGEVEVDETFIGNDKTIKPKGQKKGRGYHHKHKIVALVDRNAGTARTMVVDDLKASTLAPIVRENVNREARLMTDEAAQYTVVGKEYAEHGVVHHGKGEYVRGDIHTNTIEGFFSIFKRGMKGVYQHAAKKHLHRYAVEFEFRYNHRIKLGYDDMMRTKAILRGISGKRLTYRGPSQKVAPFLAL